MDELPREMRFFIFLLENYAFYRGRSADEILAEWDRLDLTERIYQMYERYHCEDLNNAFADIDSMMAEAKSAN